MLITEYLSEPKVVDYFTTYLERLPYYKKSNAAPTDCISDLYLLAEKKQLKAVDDKEANRIIGGYLRNLQSWSVIDYSNRNKYKLAAPNTAEWNWQRLEVYDDEDVVETLSPDESLLDTLNIEENIAANYGESFYLIYDLYFKKQLGMTDIVSITGMSLGNISAIKNVIEQNLNDLKNLHNENRKK